MKADIKNLLKNVNRAYDAAVTVDVESIKIEIEKLKEKLNAQIFASDDLAADITLNRMVQLKAIVMCIDCEIDIKRIKKELQA